MSQTFIYNLEQIVLANIENDQFGVSELAQEINLSRSQILRKIKSLTGKSANVFIREIRLNEATKLILKTDLTVSEIAYKVGFSSPSYFNKCFLDFYNQTPLEFKKSNSENTSDIFEKEKKTSVKTYKNYAVGISLIILIVLLIYYFNSRNSNDIVTDILNHPSIAVLPLEDYSENKDYDYLSSGITEAINLELSRNKSIRVISRGSCERFKYDTLTPYGEIAKELDVNLLLEGSVFPIDDSLLVIVQLIKPFPKEKHIWSNKYHSSTKNILQLVENISEEIAKEISNSLIQNSGGINNYKLNSLAYSNYLKGRYLWNHQKLRYESLKRAKEYLEKSIEIDPNFALAYVTLAEIYISINKLLGDNEVRLLNRENARKLVDTAFELDNSLAEAYITKGNILGKFDWDWNNMRENAEKALLIDPNSAKAHQILSNYYIVKGNYKKAIKEAQVALNLDPLNPEIGSMVAECYYIAGDSKEAIIKYNDVLKLTPHYGFALHGMGYAFLSDGMPEKAMNAWKELQKIMQNDSLLWYYENKGFEDGLHYYIEKAKINTPQFCTNPAVISSIEMLINKPKDALEFLEIAHKYKNEDLPIMLAYPIFYPLHDNPRFNHIVSNVGVSFPN
jgi:TolB-like protein/AraC-like DNA-binding protein